MNKIKILIDDNLYKLNSDPDDQDYLIDLANKLNDIICELRSTYANLTHQQAIIMAALSVLDEINQYKLKSNHTNKMLYTSLLNNTKHLQKSLQLIKNL